MNRKDKVFFCDSNETGIMNQERMGKLKCTLLSQAK